MKKIKEEPLLFGFLFLFFIALTALAYFSTGTIESGDSFQHYLISRYAVNHPELYLDHWGKPFFTLVSSPFSQFGFLGINVFNILCSVFTAYFAYRIAQKLELKMPWAVLLLTLFSPVYFASLISGLTEPLFALVLMLSIYLCITKRYIAAALLISFHPFVRSEGSSIIFLFLLVLLFRKQWKAIPFLASGFLIYSVIGYFVFDDLLWVINHNPYRGPSVYGKGEFLHFIKEYDYILGLPLAVLFVTGLVTLAVRLGFFKRDPLPHLFPEELVLVAGACVIYLAGHSYVHWKGVMGSSGTLRVMAGMAPIAGLVALRGLNGISWLVNHQRLLVLPVVAFLGYAVVSVPFKQYDFPYTRSVEEQPLADCAAWIKDQGDDAKVYYLYPYLPFALDIDPYDRTRAGSLWEFGPEIPSGSYIIWDSHFCPEAKIPLERIRDDKAFDELRTFISPPFFTRPDGSPGNFEVYLFRKR